MNQKRRSYPSDLTDQQWKLIKDLIPIARSGGRRRETNIREVINAIYYLVRSGCPWRHLPHDFPHWRTVYDYFYKWKAQGVWQRLHDKLAQSVRIYEKRESEPSELIADSQSVKAHFGEFRSYDGFKKVRGRKRHIIVDTLGLIQGLRVHSATSQDRTEGAELLRRYPHQRPVKAIYADRAYNGYFSEFSLERFGVKPTLMISIQGKKIREKRYEPLVKSNLTPKRWIVERTFAWFNHYRRLSRDYERKAANSEAMIYICMIQLMLRRLTYAQNFN